MISLFFDYVMMIFTWLPEPFHVVLIAIFSVLFIVLVGKIIKWLWDLIPLL